MLKLMNFSLPTILKMSHVVRLRKNVFHKADNNNEILQILLTACFEYKEEESHCGIF